MARSVLHWRMLGVVEGTKATPPATCGRQELVAMLCGQCHQPAPEQRFMADRRLPAPSFRWCSARTSTMIRLFLRTSLTLASVLANLAIPSAAEESWTGASLLQGCRAVATKLNPDTDLFGAGVCAGEIRALIRNAGALKDTQIRSCMPSQAGVRQVAKVIVSYLDHHQAILHKELSDLILLALTDAWPCPVAE